MTDRAPRERLAGRLFRQVIKQWFWDCYDHVLVLLSANFILFVVLMGGLFAWLTFLVDLLADEPAVAHGVALFATVAGMLPILLTVWFAPLGYYGELSSEEKPAGFRALAIGLQRAGFRCWAYFQCCCAVAAVLVINIWFYMAGPGLPESLGEVRFFLAGVCFWLLLVAVIIAAIGIPVVVRQRQGPANALRVAWRTLLRYPGFMAVLFLWLGGLWVLGIGLRMVGLILFAFSGTAMMLNSMYDVLKEHEQNLERDQTPRPPPATWAEMKQREEEEERERMNRMRYQRTIRDILKPWED